MKSPIILLAFGLAKAMEPTGTSSTDAMRSPTLILNWFEELRRKFGADAIDNR